MHCENCEFIHEWYKPCYLNYLRANFTNWTSKDKKIDRFIREMQLKIDDSNNNMVVFEWIPYNQFSDIKKIGKGDFNTVYLAVWKDSLLHYDYKNKMEWMRKSDQKVVLKCFYNSQNITDELLNEVYHFFL